MIFRYDTPIYKNDKHFASNPGTADVIDYALEHPPTGGVRLKEIGKKPLYSIIQKAKSNCDLQTVLESCVHQNQLSVATADDVKSAISDFTGLSSMAEWYSGMKNLESVWSDLPVDVREQFNSSPSNFVSSIGQLDFNDKISVGFDKYFGSLSKRIDVIPDTDNNANINIDNVPNNNDSINKEDINES